MFASHSATSHVDFSLTTAPLNKESRAKVKSLLKGNTHQLQLPLLVAALISPVFLFQARNMTNDTWAKKSLIRVDSPPTGSDDDLNTGSLDLIAAREPEAQCPH